MSVKTLLTLSQAQSLFPKYGLTDLVATKHGVVDSTYHALSQTSHYILKKYEYAHTEKILEDIDLLKQLKKHHLNTPYHLEKQNSWHLYTHLKGVHITQTKSHHIQALARFLAKFHPITTKIQKEVFINPSEMKKLLRYAKLKHFQSYKTFHYLKEFKDTNDGFIHGDIFKDNVLFEASKVGLIDFIDSGSGSYAFDIAVLLVGFEALKHKKLYIKLFLQAYNSHAKRKISYDIVIDYISIATHFYALKRLKNSPKNAQKLLRSIR